MSYVPKRGDFIWLDFTPQSGHEQKGRRPALVISNDLYNLKTGLAIVCPITSTKRDYPLHIEITGHDQVKGYIMVEQIRAVDYSARNAEFIGQAPAELLADTVARLLACL